ncbi:MAG TPA: CBS domain-containing protein [Nitrospira sp.]|nr:CBS domain-containing protein [Nitrospira sp.]
MSTKTTRGKKSGKDFASLTVKDVMNKQVQFAHLKTKGDVIASLMIEGFGAVPVVNGGRRLAGIVSEHDLLAAIDDGHELGRITAADIMTGNPYSVRMETTLGTLVHVLRASDLVRVPVVDANDKLVGIVARRDLLRTYLAGNSSKGK